MRLLRITTTLILLCTITFVQSQNLKPFVRAFQTTKTLNQIKGAIITEFQINGIDVIGQYQPANDMNRYVLVVTTQELINASKKVGGITATAAVMRVAITVENNKTKVTYTNPKFWVNAFYGSEFPKVSAEFNMFHKKMKASLTACSDSYREVTIGSREGISLDKLRKYKYKKTAPSVKDYIVLAEFASHQHAIDNIESGLVNKVANVSKVYALEIPGKQIKIYGFGMDYEYEFMYKLDIGSPKHTAALPYELAVIGKQIVMLAPKYRLALCFPDCSSDGFKAIGISGELIQAEFMKLVQ